MLFWSVLEFSVPYPGLIYARFTRIHDHAQPGICMSARDDINVSHSNFALAYNPALAYTDCILKSRRIIPKSAQKNKFGDYLMIKLIIGESRAPKAARINGLNLTEIR